MQCSDSLRREYDDDQTGDSPTSLLTSTGGWERVTANPFRQSGRCLGCQTCEERQKEKLLVDNDGNITSLLTELTHHSLTHPQSGPMKRHVRYFYRLGFYRALDIDSQHVSAKNHISLSPALLGSFDTLDRNAFALSKRSAGVGFYKAAGCWSITGCNATSISLDRRPLLSRFDPCPPGSRKLRSLAYVLSDRTAGSPPFPVGND